MQCASLSTDDYGEWNVRKYFATAKYAELTETLYTVEMSNHLSL